MMSTRDNPVPLEGISEMKAKSTFARVALASAAAATAVAAFTPTIAAAQSYGYQTQGGYAYDYAPPSNYDTTSRCTYVESPVYMPDGRTEKRMVQVCPDRNGRYQVVQ